MENVLLTGTVQSGGTSGARPLPGVPVALFEAGAHAPRAVGTTRTDADGRFSLHLPRGALDGILYATASPGGGVVLATVLGPRAPGEITVNELTTVAAAYSMAQFARGGAIAGDPFGLRIAAGMSGNLADPRTGASSRVLLASPNGDETNALRSTRALANLLAACVRGRPGAVERLLELATPPHGPAPRDTFQALVSIARHPANHVEGIYAQARALEVYQPSLERQPDAWTIAVKVNDSGSDEFLFGGPGNIAFDRDGYAWIANNVRQGTPHSGRFIVVLRPDGRPAAGEDGKPRSPVFGGGILGPGFGIGIDSRGHVWVGNYGWGGDDPPDGSVTQLDAGGRAISPPEGWLGGTHRVQATVPDGDGNLWLASYGNDRVVVFPGGDPRRAFWFRERDGSAPFDIVITRDGSAWVTNSGGLGPRATSSVCRYRIRGGALHRELRLEFGHSLKGMSLDSLGNLWIAAGGDDAVYLLSPQGEVLGTYAGGGVSAPWSAVVDGDDNVWVANFGPMSPGSNYTHAALSHLAGANPDTRPPGLGTGDPISPSTGYALPSAGSPVLLHNGEPLYGAGAPPCFCPFMRQTNCAIDQAGNVWAINNWKPDFDADAAPRNGNPGGDGIVIFVGLAAPPADRRRDA